MSDERPAPPPPGHVDASGATLRAGASDTPRDGVPAFADTARDGIPAAGDTPRDGVPAFADTARDSIPAADDTPRDGVPAFADTARDGIPAADDTPRDGVPAFAAGPPAPGADADEIHVAVEGVPVTQDGPAPDHASEYVPPRPLPKPADHKTIDLDRVRIAPEADPRRAQTQKALHVLKREEAQRHLLLLGVGTSPGATSVRPSSRSLPDTETRSRRVGLYVGAAIALAIVLGLGVIGFAAVTSGPGAASTPGATRQPAAPSAATSPTAQGARLAPVASATLGAPATPAASATGARAGAPTASATRPGAPEPPAAASTSPTTRREKPRGDEAKPINE